MKVLLSIVSVCIAVGHVTDVKANERGNAYIELREEHWFEAMEIGGVTSEILYAIALTESGNSFNGMREYGPWPWAMNINQKPKFYSSRAAAREVLAQEVEKGNKQVAVGMWQIHLRYNAHYVDDPLDLIDPVTNLYVAAMVLKGCGEIYDTTRDVLSCYHSGDVDEAGVAYAERVLKLARKWGKPFRLTREPGNLRFTHEATAEIQVAETESPVTEPEPVKEEPPIDIASLRMLASIDSAPVTSSHKAFLDRIGEAVKDAPRRVVLVE